MRESRYVHHSGAGYVVYPGVRWCSYETGRATASSYVAALVLIKHMLCKQCSIDPVPRAMRVRQVHPRFRRRSYGACVPHCIGGQESGLYNGWRRYFGSAVELCKRWCAGPLVRTQGSVLRHRTQSSEPGPLLASIIARFVGGIHIVGLVSAWVAGTPCLVRPPRASHRKVSPSQVCDIVRMVGRFQAGRRHLQGSASSRVTVCCCRGGCRFAFAIIAMITQ